eukprot:CAMPEP_0113941356 /NCGR_PEP_ID=MMETSP1339-20121228/7289_1 /TAXON_ID=94617 /ORGANISM="Fibrocapsa japonica" /LENGTH=171 /DNA_ID=CAMNT_0000945475 /DNA_START=125 /DNA_END=640 /DNA_ORIENTATION=+ /assembly_acc=CAM_ASM_000762
MNNLFEDVSKNEILMEEMALYAEKYSIQALMQEYMQRLVLSKPSDPVKFLIEEISKRPYVPPPSQIPEDKRPANEQRMFRDKRPGPEKEDLLLELFNMFRRDVNEKVPKAKMLVKLRRDKEILLERFPKHFHELLRTMEMTPAHEQTGMISWDEFYPPLMECLSGPGGRIL